MTAHCGACLCDAQDQLYVSEVNAAHAVGRGGLERLAAAGLELGGAGFFECVGEAIGAGRFGAEQGEEPVQVRVLQPDGEAARLAVVAGSIGSSPGAQQQLPEPEAEPLFADARRAVDQDGAGELTGSNGGAERGAFLVMTLERTEPAHVPARARSQASGSTGSMLPSRGTRTWNSMCGPSADCSPPTVPMTSPAFTCWLTCTPMFFRYR